jgi:hypothetical protein
MQIRNCVIGPIKRNYAEKIGTRKIKSIGGGLKGSEVQWFSVAGFEFRLASSLKFRFIV